MKRKTVSLCYINLTRPFNQPWHMCHRRFHWKSKWPSLCVTFYRLMLPNAYSSKSSSSWATLLITDVWPPPPRWILRGHEVVTLTPIWLFTNGSKKSQKWKHKTPILRWFSMAPEKCKEVQLCRSIFDVLLQPANQHRMNTQTNRQNLTTVVVIKIKRHYWTHAKRPTCLKL